MPASNSLIRWIRGVKRNSSTLTQNGGRHSFKEEDDRLRAPRYRSAYLRWNDFTQAGSRCNRPNFLHVFERISELVTRRIEDRRFRGRTVVLQCHLFSHESKREVNVKGKNNLHTMETQHYDMY